MKVKIESLEIPGVKIVKSDVRSDSRGYTFKPFSIKEINENGLQFEVKEIFYSLSSKNVIRGMHFQLPPFAQAKMVQVIKGRITDVVLDLRIDSPTYGKYISLELEEKDGKLLYIPKGLGHGFASLEDDSVVLYLFDTPYSIEHECGVRYDSFGYEWKVENPVLSPRDLELIEFHRFKSPMRMQP